MMHKMTQLLLAGATLVACTEEHQPPTTQELPSVTVNASTVRLDQVPVTVTAVGTTEPIARATPGTRLLGRVVSVAVSEGDRVRAGDVLVRIESRDLAARRGQAESGLREAKAVFENAATTVKRMQSLYAQSAVPKQQLDEAETGLERAKAAFSQAESALKEVDANLRYSNVASPLEGVVVRKFVQQGDMAAPGAPLFTVEQQDTMKVTVEVSEGDLAYVHVDRPVMVEIESLRGTLGEGRLPEWEGLVEAVVPSASQGSRTFEVKVILPNMESVVRSGMFARVRFQKDQRPGILVPTTAVVREGQLDGVYVIEEGRARLRWVRLGKTFGDHTEVIAGVRAGEVVAVSGLEGLRDLRRVEVSGNG